jgi:hypothetical protein
MSGCVSGGVLLFYGPDDGLAASNLYSRLSMDAFASACMVRRAGHRVPFSSDLLGLFS